MPGAGEGEGSSEGPVRGLFVGLTTVDLVYRADRPVRPDEKIRASGCAVSAGGPATNAAVTFAALGGHATLCSVVGDHPLAVLARTDLGDHAVALVDALPDRTEPPPLSTAVVAADGTRQLVGINDSGLDAPAPDLAALVAASAIVLVDGHHPRLAVAAATAAADASVPVVLDAGSWKHVTESLLPLSDVVACSGDFRTPGRGDVESTVRDLREQRHVRRGVVTAGPDPVLWWEGDAEGLVDVPRVRAVDTLGAGDAFHGALAWSLASGADLETAVQAAVAVASLRVSVAGPRAWLSRLTRDDARPEVRHG